MKSHRDIASDEQIEQHSLPGINMAGKEAPGKQCECSEEEDAAVKKESDRPGAPVSDEPRK